MTENTTLISRNLTTTDAVDLDQLARRAPATADLLELAAWLAAYGPAHLSAIARIELAERLISRRRFL
ncbi:MAG: ABC transporter substrate-binding protein, partial [Chloroflexales bacterium]|nr:ABC transporter substrate-binding protein [Chloroflexales bacterium]